MNQERRQPACSACAAECLYKICAHKSTTEADASNSPCLRNDSAETRVIYNAPKFNGIPHPTRDPNTGWASCVPSGSLCVASWRSREASTVLRFSVGAEGESPLWSTHAHSSFAMAAEAPGSAANLSAWSVRADSVNPDPVTAPSTCRSRHPIISEQCTHVPIETTCMACMCV